MITNERQYKITQKAADGFRKALFSFNEIDLIKQGIDPIIAAAQRQSLEQQIIELDEDLLRYDDLRSAKGRRLFPETIASIGENLIKARIMQSLSQKDLAVKLGMKEQQVQRYEQDRYLTANLTRISEVAEALQLNLHAFFEMRNSALIDKLAPNLRGIDGFDPAKLPVKEMKKRGWLEEVYLPVEFGGATDLELAAAFVSRAFVSSSMRSLHRQKIRAGSEQDDYALFAWKAKVLLLARKVSGNFRGHQKLDPEMVKELVKLSVDVSGPVKAVKMLREHGVAAVLVGHMPATHLDGAALLLEDEIPVIALTLRHNRLDNFWFTLLHEVGHIMLHRDQGLKDGFFDESEVASTDALEKQANDFAVRALIPDEAWKRSFVRYSATENQIIEFAKSHCIGPAIVAGRLRRERNNYRLFPSLVGNGQVRDVFNSAELWES